MATSCCSRTCRFTLPPGGIVGVIGPNGAGKSTLFKLITGQETARQRRRSTSARPCTSAMSTRAATISIPTKNVWEEISDGLDYMKVNGHDMSTRAYVGAFNFKGADQQKNVGKLSGGERNRVHIAKMLKRGGNVLLLDEPTNDLDVETLRRARRGDRELRRLRRGHQPRPLLPRSPRDAHPRVRGRQPLSNGSKAISKPMRKTSAAASATKPPAAPDDLPEADAVTLITVTAPLQIWRNEEGSSALSR